MTTEHFESTHKPSEVLKPAEDLYHRTHTIRLPHNFFKLIRFFIIFVEQTLVSKDSANAAIKYVFSVS